MASTKIQKKCELWIVDNWLPERYDDQFSEQRIQLQGRKYFEFDAVNLDQSIVGNVSTATAYTYSGNLASGKKSKIRADCLMLSLVEAQRKLLILTEKCMYKFSLSEQASGRLPLDIEILHAELPDTLISQLVAAREKASREVRGRT